MKSCFARHDIPRKVRNEDGLPYTLEEFVREYKTFGLELSSCNDKSVSCTSEWIRKENSPNCEEPRRNGGKKLMNNFKKILKKKELKITQQ